MSDVSSTSSTTYTGMSGAGGGSKLRLTGMATGLDVDGTVKKMLSADQTKIDQAKQAQQIMQWRKEAYQKIIDEIKDLQNTYFSSTSADNLLSDNNYSAFNITSTFPTIANATAGTGAAEGTYNVNVLSLATAATMTGGSLDSQLKFETGLAGDTINITEGSNNFSIQIPSGYNGTTIADAASAIQAQLTANGVTNLKVSNDGGQLKFVSSDFTNSITVNDTNGVLTPNQSGLTIAMPSSTTTTAFDNTKMAGDNINITINGVTQSIAIPSDYNQTIDGTVGYLNNQFNSLGLSSLRAVKNGTQLQFLNSDPDHDITIDDTAGAGGTGAIGGASTITVAKNTGTYDTSFDNNSINSDWAGKFFTINDGTSNYQIDFTNFAGTTPTDVAAYINQQISGMTGLSGKLSVSTFTDNGGTYLRFNATTSSSLKITSGNVRGLPTDTLRAQASQYTKLTSLDSGLNGIVHLNFMCNSKSYNVTLDNSASGKNGSANLSDLMSAIYQQTSGAINASIDDITGKLSLKSSKTGTTAVMELTGGDSNVINALGLSNVQMNVPISGTDARVSITNPGSSVANIITENSNKFSLNNINYSLTNLGTSSITVASDTQKVVDRFKDFLKKYNSIVDDITTKLTEKKNYDYKPLTDAQKSSMSASDITAWNTKAQAGILRDDMNLRSLLTNLRGVFFDPVEGSNLTFNAKQLGLDTSNEVSKAGEVNFVTGGEETFKEALETYGTDILDLFNKQSSVSYLEADNDAAKKKERYNSEGIMQRLSDIVTDNVGYAGTTSVSDILTKYANYQDDYSQYSSSGTNTIPDQIYKQTLLIKTLTTKMNDDSEKYYKQFSTLETIMNQLNSQQATLSSMLGG